MNERYYKSINADFGNGTGIVKYYDYLFNIHYLATELNSLIEYHQESIEEDCEDLVAINFNRIHETIKFLHPEYNALKGFSAYIENIESFLIGNNPKLNIDYRLFLRGKSYEYAQYCHKLMCSYYQLEVGDTFIISGKTFTIKTSESEYAVKTLNSQGYYHYRLIGGVKYNQFMKDKESVAKWVAYPERWILK